MSLISRLFTSASASRESVRPLWHRIVAIAREEQWYAAGGIADTVSGRFDAVTLVMALVMLRMERGNGAEGSNTKRPLVAASARLTELFVEDMDGQLRQSGVGDLVVGKRMGKLVSVLGGRIGALRTALGDPAPAEEQEMLGAVLERNVTRVPDAPVEPLAAAVRGLHAQLQSLSDEDLLAARIAR
ncbi:ubiquinol-cytochrome C chaperone family protein [Novosphingobium profundi]|uniref:ubiquinol-cytochrome C chaperone family protein n=1 Tax=Novosphingobium profundi TaxID=1774954 RepID=UPI0031B9F7A4